MSVSFAYAPNAPGNASRIGPGNVVQVFSSLNIPAGSTAYVQLFFTDGNGNNLFLCDGDAPAKVGTAQNTFVKLASPARNRGGTPPGDTRGLVDGAAISTFIGYFNAAGALVDSGTLAGAHWDAVSGLIGLFGGSGGVAGIFRTLKNSP